MKCMEIIHAKFRSARKLRVLRCGWFYTKSWYLERQWQKGRRRVLSIYRL